MMDITAIRNQQHTDLEKMGLIAWEIRDIECQIAGLYNLKKQKGKEFEDTKLIMIEKARRGEMPYRKEEE